MQQPAVASTGTPTTKQRSAVVLLGPPGSGKTTVTEKLIARNGVAALKTGHLLREEQRRGTPLGEKLKPFLKQGKLAPTELVIEVVAQSIQQLDASVILFDGLPRREDEIRPFFNQIEQAGLSLAAVVVFELSRAEAAARLIRRQARQDDDPETVNRRLDIYKQDTDPVIEYFKTHYSGQTYFESVEKSIDQVVASVLSTLQAAELREFSSLDNP